VVFVCAASVSALAGPSGNGSKIDPRMPKAVKPAELPAPAPEISTTLDAGLFPAVPSFELPQAEPGFENPRALRVKGKKLLDTKITVKGYIIWVYSCVDEVRTPGEKPAAAQKRIDEDPTLCERPKFYLGMDKKTPVEKGLWVVDVPRLPNKLEKARLPKDELKNWPKVPKFKLGDYVAVTGDFKLSSPHSERNSDGLLVFASLAPAKPAKPSAAAKQEPAAATKKPTPTSLKAVPLSPADPQAVEKSKQLLATGNRAFGSKQFAEAIKAFRDAATAWPENHLAWYGMGGAFAAQGEWDKSFDAFTNAVMLRPDVPMYQMWTGVALYEKAVKAAREDEARRQNVKPDQVQVDLSAINFERAKQHLEAAVALNADLWRAQFYLGRVYRAADQGRAAAEAFMAGARGTTQSNGPWIALAELYRKWDYTAEALKVAELGTAKLPASAESSDLWYVLGMTHDDAGENPQAVEAFTKALELKADNYKAAFQRGQAYFRLSKWAEAKADLELFVKNAGPAMAFAKQQANKMLMDIAAKPAKPAKK